MTIFLHEKKLRHVGESGAFSKGFMLFYKEGTCKSCIENNKLIILYRNDTKDNCHDQANYAESPYPEEAVLDMVFDINISETDTQ